MASQAAESGGRPRQIAESIDAIGSGVAPIDGSRPPLRRDLSGSGGAYGRKAVVAAARWELNTLTGGTQDETSESSRNAIGRLLNVRDSSRQWRRDVCAVKSAPARAGSVAGSMPDMGAIERYAQHAGACRLLVREGDAAVVLLIILEGWARGYKITRSGGRHITEFLLPGGAVIPLCATNRHMDCSIGAPTPVRFAAHQKPTVRSRPSAVLRLCAHSSHSAPMHRTRKADVT